MSNFTPLDDAFMCNVASDLFKKIGEELSMYEDYEFPQDFFKKYPKHYVDALIKRYSKYWGNNKTSKPTPIKEPMLFFFLSRYFKQLADAKDEKSNIQIITKKCNKEK